MFKKFILSLLLASATLCAIGQDKQPEPVQCKEITTKGNRCMRAAKVNGYCSQHNSDLERCKITTAKGQQCKNKATDKYNGKCHVHRFAKD